MTFRAIPLLLIALLIYNAIVFIFASYAPETLFYSSATLDTTTNKLVEHSAKIFSFRMLSAAASTDPNAGVWTFTRADAMILLGLILLALEMLKATYTRGGQLADQAFSTILLILFLVEFLLVKQAGTAVFFLLTIMSAFDVVVGSIIGIRTARRDIGFGGTANTL